jgi:hypothetical protein
MTTLGMILGFWAQLREQFLFLHPFLAVITCILSGITAGITIWLYWRTRPRLVPPAGLSEGGVIINWSGHALPEAPWRNAYTVWEPKEAVSFKTESWNTLQASVQKMLRELPIDLEKRLLRGDPRMVIAIPQLAAGLSILLAILHGRDGIFPCITCPLKVENTKNTFMLPEPINLSDVRFTAREERKIE